MTTNLIVCALRRPENYARGKEIRYDERCSADHAAFLSEGRILDSHFFFHVGQPDVPDAFAQPVDEGASRLHILALDDDELGIIDHDDVAQAQDKPAGHVVDQGRAERISLARKIADRIDRNIVGHPIGEKQGAYTARAGVLDHLPQALCGHHCLEAAAISADAGRAVHRVQCHVAYFPGKALGSADELPMRHDPRSESLVQSVDDDKVCHAIRNALLPLRHRLITVPNSKVKKFVVSRFDQNDKTLSEEYTPRLAPDSGLKFGGKNRSLDDLYVTGAVIADGRMYAISAAYSTLLTIDLATHSIVAAHAIPGLMRPTGIAIRGGDFYIVGEGGKVFVISRP